MNETSTPAPPRLTHKQWFRAICLGLLLIAGIVAGSAYILRPPRPQPMDDFADDPAPAPTPAVNSTNPAASPAAIAPATQRTAVRPRRNNPNRVAAAEAVDIYERSATRTDVVAKSAVMSVTTAADGKRTFGFAYRPRWTDRLYSLLAETVQDPDESKAMKITPVQAASINAISVAPVFPDADKPALEELYNAYAAAADDAAKKAARAQLLERFEHTGDKIAADVEQRQRARVAVLNKDQIVALRALTLNPRPRRGTTAAPRAGVVGDLP